MHNLYLLAHAGVDHATEAEASTHSNKTTVIVIITAIALFVLALAVRRLNQADADSKEEPTKEK